MKQILLYIVTVMFVLMAASMAPAQNKTLDDTQRAVLKVGNLTCGGCFYAIKNGLKPLKGFTGMGSNLFRKMVAVDFTPPLTPGIIEKVITDLGYPATVESVESIEEKETFAYLNSQQQKGFNGGCCGGQSGEREKEYRGRQACQGPITGQRCPYVPETTNGLKIGKKIL